MYSEHSYSWRPAAPLWRISGGRRDEAFQRWMAEQFGARARELYLALLGIHSTRKFFCFLLRYDAAEFVELLFPRYPRLFLDSEFFLFPEPGPDFPRPRTAAQVSFLSACALTGSVGCLSALLELGADPNGPREPEQWNTLEPSHFPTGRPALVTPLDCARYGGHADCCTLLELYGGETMAEHYGLPESSLPLTPVDGTLVYHDLP